jgi:hypothetical protein
MNMNTKETDIIADDNMDFETRSLDAVCVNESHLQHKWWHNLKYLAVGGFFGMILYKSEVISWFRIQEMFRFDSFHMYGIIGTAVVTGAISVALLKKFGAKSIYGEKIEIHKKAFNKGQVIGGVLFGFGWALTGACPGPMYAQLGSGIAAASVMIISAISGTWIYGLLREKLPH